VVFVTGSATGLSFATVPAQVPSVVGGTGAGAGVTVAQNPVSLAVDHSGGLMVGDGTLMVVRELTASGSERGVACAGDIATSGYGGDGGTADDASCNGPFGLSVDRAGDLYMADYENNRVRVVPAATGTLFGVPVTAGDITTVAGDGTWGYAGDDGAATSAQLAYPAGVALDASGNLVICDSGNNVLRVVATTTGTFYGRSMTAGDIYTVAGTGTAGSAGDGGPATSAELDQPAGVAVDAHGDLVVADLGTSRIRVVATTTGTFYGRSMTAGDIYTVAGTGTAGSAGDGGPATSAELDQPAGVAVDAHGDLVVADLGASRVRLVAERSATVYGVRSSAGDIYTLAGTGTPRFSGDGGPAVRAALSAPRNVVVDASGNIVIGDSGNNRVRVIAASTGTFYGQVIAAGDIDTVAGTGTLGGYSGDGGSAHGALLNLPTGVAADAAGQVVVADQNNNRVRFEPVHSGTHFGRSMTAGRLYTVVGDGTAGGSGDGGPGTSAEVNAPSGVAFDAAGNVLVAEFAGNRIRVVANGSGTFYGRTMAAGDIYTVAGTGAVGSTGDGGPATAAEINAPENVTVDGTGNVVLTEFYGNEIRVIAEHSGTFYGRSMTAGDIYTVAGTGAGGSTGDEGPATAATFQQPLGLAVDRFGNLVVGDYLNNEVRVVATDSGTFYGRPMTAGDVYTVAGDGTKGSSGDGGPATAAELSSPAGIAVDATGNLIVADSANNEIRVVAALSGQFFGQAMTTGDIYTVVGGGSSICPAGIGSPTLGGGVSLSVPLGVAFAETGSLIVSDTADNCVRDLVTSDETPGPPRSVGTTAGIGAASVTWHPPATNGGSAVTGYVVTAQPGGAAAHAGATSSSATLTGLVDGTAYVFTVAATNAIGTGPASANSREVTPRS
jgi:hypothetical protein